MFMKSLCALKKFGTGGWGSIQYWQIFLFDLFSQTMPDRLKCVGCRVKQVCGKIRKLNQRGIFQRTDPRFPGFFHKIFSFQPC